MPRADPANRALWQAMEVLGQAYPSILIRKDGMKASVRRQMVHLGELFPDEASLYKALEIVGDSESRSRIAAGVAAYRGTSPL